LESRFISYLRFRVVPGPFFTYEALNETEGLRLINLSDTIFNNVWSDPHTILISGFHTEYNPSLVFKARIINYSVREYVLASSGNCQPDNSSHKQFTNILKTLTNFDFCKPGDSIGIMFVEKDFSGFNSHVSDSCLIRLRVK
jgi:hypothetical protein